MRRARYLVALRYVAKNEGDAARVLTAFEAADNMTILSGTLNILARDFSASDEARTILKTFKTRFADNPLVINKWLAVQATVPGPSTLARVRELVRSDYYSADNPKRIRALVGSFSSANPTGFNDVSGDGFELLA